MNLYVAYTDKEKYYTVADDFNDVSNKVNKVYKERYDTFVQIDKIELIAYENMFFIDSADNLKKTLVI